MSDNSEHNNTTVVMSHENTAASNTSYPGKPLTPDDMEINVPGFEIISKIGSGGMGHVFLARQIALKRLVAIKSLKISDSDDVQIENIMSEAATMAALNHPNIVGCYDIIRVEKHIYVVMEYVPGQMSVRRLVKRYGPLPEDIVVKMLQDVVGGLNYIKERGYIHHDLKPDNLLVYDESDVVYDDIYDLFSRSDTRVKICDFGIATHVKKDDDGNDTTARGTVSIMGTPNYMAPEQIASPVDNDFRADIYALGCTALFMLTGKQPFDIHDRKKLFAYKLTHDIPEPNDLDIHVNEHLSELIGKMGRRDPDERYHEYEKILSELEDIADELPQNKLLSPRRHPKGLSFWKNACVAMLVIVAFFIVFAGRSCMRTIHSRRQHISFTNVLDNWSGIDKSWKIKKGSDKRKTTVMSTDVRSRPITSRFLLGRRQTLEFEAKHPDDGSLRFSLSSGKDLKAQLTWNKVDDESMFALYIGGRLYHIDDVDSSIDWLKCKVVFDNDGLSVYLNDEQVQNAKLDNVSILSFTVEMLSVEKMMLKNVFIYDNF